MKININNYEAFLIDYMEGRLDSAEILQLKVFCDQNNIDFEELTEDLPVLDSPDITFEEKECLLKSETAPFDDMDDNQCKLEPDTSIVFKDKESLKKKAIILPLYAKIAAAAAVIILLFGLFWLPKNENDGTNQQPVMVELTTETNESYPKDTLISPENSTENQLNEKRRNVYENEQIASNENVAHYVSEKQQDIENQHNSSSIEKEEDEELIENETEEIQPTRIEPELLATLAPRNTTEVIVSEDFAVEYGVAHGNILYPTTNESYLTQNQQWDGNYEYDGQHLSLIGRGISWLSNGRYTSISEVISDGLHIAKHEVIDLSEQAIAYAYIKADESIDEAKARWEERFERKE